MCISDTKCLFMLDMIVWHRLQLGIVVTYLVYITYILCGFGWWHGHIWGRPFTNLAAKLNFVSHFSSYVLLCLGIMQSWLEYKANRCVANTWSIVDIVSYILNLIWRMVIGYLIQLLSFEVKKVNPNRSTLVVVAFCFEKDKWIWMYS